MSATFTIDEILTLDGAVLHGATKTTDQTFSISTDSRAIRADQDLYLALKGERFDGHTFVLKAFENGAGLAIIDSASAVSVGESLPAEYSTRLMVSVPNTLAAYQGLARLYLRRHSAKVIAITGSSGKTTTKEMTAAATSCRVVHKSLANENNEIGVPKTILSMPAETEILILEMGMRGLGQIAELAACGLPDIGVITCAGTAHIELLGSRENIARAKCELLAALDSERGRAIIGDGSDYLLAQARQDFSGLIEVCPALEIVRVDSHGTTFKIPDSASEQEFFVRAHGRVLLEDAWCAVAAARAAGLSDSEIAAGLSKFEAVEGRGNAVQSSHGATIVDESYNANPDSMRCAVEAILSHAYPQPDKIVVLGAMAELGDFSEPLHLELGRWLKDKPISLLVTVGPVASAIASGAKGATYEIAAVATQDEALGRVLPRLGRDSCVMVKGSHSTNLDKLVQNILL